MPAKKGNKYAVGNKGGRKTLYKSEYNDQAYKLTLLGAIDTELADFFGVNELTINRWKKAHKEFSKSIKEGKLMADANVTNRLYQRAMGFEHDSEEIKVVDHGVIRVKTRKIYPPDSVAAIFWLKNRQPDRWRDKQIQEITGKDGTALQIIVQSKQAADEINKLG